jgi:hypothetical protein
MTAHCSYLAPLHARRALDLLAAQGIADVASLEVGENNTRRTMTVYCYVCTFTQSSGRIELASNTDRTDEVCRHPMSGSAQNLK